MFNIDIKLKCSKNVIIFVCVQRTLYIAVYVRIGIGSSGQEKRKPPSSVFLEVIGYKGGATGCRGPTFHKNLH